MKEIIWENIKINSYFQSWLKSWLKVAKVNDLRKKLFVLILKFLLWITNSCVVEFWHFFACFLSFPRDLPKKSYFLRFKSSVEISRLCSRNSPMKTAKMLLDTNFNHDHKWRENSDTLNHDMPCMVEKPPGINQSLKLCTTINRVQTKHGRCADFILKMTRISSPEYNCGPQARQFSMSHRNPKVLIENRK